MSISIVPCHRSTAVDTSRRKRFSMRVLLLSNIPFRYCSENNLHIFVCDHWGEKTIEIAVQQTLPIDPCLRDLFCVVYTKTDLFTCANPITKYRVPVHENKSSSLRLYIKFCSVKFT